MIEVHVYMRGDASGTAYAVGPLHAHKVGDILTVPAVDKFGVSFPEAKVEVRRIAIDGAAICVDVEWLKKVEEPTDD